MVMLQGKRAPADAGKFIGEGLPPIYVSSKPTKRRLDQLHTNGQAGGRKAKLGVIEINNGVAVATNRQVCSKTHTAPLI